MTDCLEAPDSIDPTLANEAIEKAENADPTEPIDITDPTEPIDKIEPLEPMLSTELSDRIDQSDVPEPDMRLILPSGAGSREFPSIE